jgi:hypothetical protein
VVPKPIDQITETDINDLVGGGVSERKTLDYKQQLPEANDAAKRELLADVSSFANTLGGDLIFGVAESAVFLLAYPGCRLRIPIRKFCGSIISFERDFHLAFGIRQGQCCWRVGGTSS